MKSLSESIVESLKENTINEELNDSIIKRFKKFLNKEDLYLDGPDSEAIAYITSDKSDFNDNVGIEVPSICICMEDKGFYIYNNGMEDTGNVITAVDERTNDVDFGVDDKGYDITSDGKLYKYTPNNAKLLGELFSML